MNILDCITYFDEETIINLRFNILYEHVTKFIVCEGAYDHRGNKRDLNFDISKFKEFKDKIIYLPVTDFPNLKDPWAMLRYQRDKAYQIIQDYEDNSFVMVSDVDEIPNPKKINEFLKKNKKIGVFKQLLFYYKLNMLNTTNNFWYGTKICKKKNLQSPDWLRGYKIKTYPWWRLDKYPRPYIIEDGGWHFSFLYDTDGIIKKVSSFQHTEFETDKIKNKEYIENKIKNGEDIFNRNYKFQSIKIDSRFPEYIQNHKTKYTKWIVD